MGTGNVPANPKPENLSERGRRGRDRDRDSRGREVEGGEEQKQQVEEEKQEGEQRREGGMSFRRAGMNSPSVHDLIERFNNKEPLVSVFDEINTLQPNDEGNKSHKVPPLKPRKPITSIDDKISNEDTTLNVDHKEVSAIKTAVSCELPPAKPRKSITGVDDKIFNDDKATNKDVSAINNSTVSCELPPAKPRKSITGIDDKIYNADTSLTTRNVENKEVSAIDKNAVSSESPPEKPRKPITSTDDKISDDDTTLNVDHKEASSIENIVGSCELPPEKPRKSITDIDDKISNNDNILTTLDVGNKDASAIETNAVSCESSPEKLHTLDQVTVSPSAVKAEPDQASLSIIVPDEVVHTKNSDNKDKCTAAPTEATNEIKLKNQTQRGYIMDEIIQTEKNYLNNLKIVLGIISPFYLTTRSYSHTIAHFNRRIFDTD